ncbi:WD repeat protein, partial [Schizosaccharomyces japonicus yFS275]
VKAQLYGNRSWIADLDLKNKLSKHTECVNALCWSESGDLLVSGGDDTKLVIWDVYDNYNVKSIINTGHTHNIFGTKFLPYSNNSKILSCSGDGLVKLFSLDRTSNEENSYGIDSCTSVWDCHRDSVKQIVPTDDGHCFLTCSTDGTVRGFDTREHHHCDSNSSCSCILVNYAPFGIELNTLSMSKGHSYNFVIGGTHPFAFLHDRRMYGRHSQSHFTRTSRCVRKFCPGGGESSNYPYNREITGCRLSNYNPHELLVSWSSDYIYLFDINGYENTPATFKEEREHLKRCNSNAKNIRKKRLRTSDQSRMLPSMTSTNYIRLVPNLYITFHSRTESYYQINMNISAFFENGDDGQYQDVFIRKRLHNCVIYIKDSIAHLSNDLSVSDRSEPTYHNRVALLRYWKACVSVIALLNDRVILETNTIIMAGWDWLYDFMNWVIRWMLGLTNHWALQMAPVPRNSEEDLVVYDPDDINVIIFHDSAEMIRAFARLDFPASEVPSSIKHFWIHKVLRSCLKHISSSFMHQSFYSWDESTVSLQDSRKSLNSSSMSIILTPLVQTDTRGTSDSSFHDEDEPDDDDDDIDEDDDLNYRVEDDDDSEEFTYENNILEIRMRARHRVAPGAQVISHERTYSGHSNVDTVRDVSFFGKQDEYVLSGSADGNLFIWSKDTSSIVAILEGDSENVNVMEGHPELPLIASCGIDSTVKVFGPGRNPNARRSKNKTDNCYRIIASNEMSRQFGSRDFYVTSRMLSRLAHHSNWDNATGEGSLDTASCNIM